MTLEWQKVYAMLLRIAPRWTPEFRREMIKAYNKAMGSVDRFLQSEHGAFAKGGRMEQDLMYRAHYLETVADNLEKVLDGALAGTIPAKRDGILKLVDEAYSRAYADMELAVAGEKLGADLTAMTGGFQGLTGEQLREVVTNNIDKLTLDAKLEANRAEIVRTAKKSIAAGMANGDSARKMAKRIEGVLQGDFNKALRIVNTETHRNSEAAKWRAAMEQNARYVAEGLPLRVTKTWVTAGDEVVRPQTRRKSRRRGWVSVRSGKANHVEMDRKTLPVGEAFALKGSKGGTVYAQYPGASGDAGNDVNCRCRCSYRTVSLEDYLEKYGGEAAPEAETEPPEVEVSGGDATMEAGKGKSFPVTEQGIQDVRAPRLQELAISPARLESASRVVLRRVKDMPLGSEVLSVYSPRMTNPRMYRSDPGVSNVVYPQPPAPYISIHNHPNKLGFSYEDLYTFVDDDMLLASLIVEHDGEMHVLEKLAGYDKDKIERLSASLQEKYVGWEKSNRIKTRIAREIMWRIGNYGVHYE